MSPEEINRTISEAIGDHQYVGLVKRGYWWRPEGKGYTANEDEAGRYTREEAARIAGDEVSIREFEPRSFYSCLNACQEMEATLTTDECWLYNRALDEILGTAGGIGSGTIDQWKWHASAPQRCEAFLRIRNLWTP